MNWLFDLRDHHTHAQEKEREREKRREELSWVSYPLIHSLNVSRGHGPGTELESGIYIMSPLWQAGLELEFGNLFHVVLVRGRNPNLLAMHTASEGLHLQEAGIGSQRWTSGPDALIWA